MPWAKSLQNNWETLKKSNYLVRAELQKNEGKKCHILTIFPALGKLTQMCIFLLGAKLYMSNSRPNS